jgi:hypothetical protein
MRAVYAGTTHPVTVVAMCNDQTTNTAAAADAQAANLENTRLRALLCEIWPLLLDDVRQGLALGAPPADHPGDDCPDCVWYRNSLAWQTRIDAGEFTELELDASI